MSNSIKREQHDNVLTIIFDQENSVANVFNEELFTELTTRELSFDTETLLRRGGRTPLAIAIRFRPLSIL